MKWLLDLFFPPLCRACDRETDLKFFCKECWQLCLLPDPVDRCKYCFEPIDVWGPLCTECRKGNRLPAIRAYVFDKEAPAYLLTIDRALGLAGFAFFQWIRLEWKEPTAIIPMPDAASLEIASYLADFFSLPRIKALKKNCTYRKELLQEGESLLLFDVRNPKEKLEKALLSLQEAFPKRVYLLSLFPT